MYKSEAIPYNWQPWLKQTKLLINNAKCNLPEQIIYAAVTYAYELTICNSVAWAEVHDMVVMYIKLAIDHWRQ